jgi:hypothetical protein
MKRLLWPGIVFLLVGSLVAVDVTMLVVARRMEVLSPIAPPADAIVAPPALPAPAAAEAAEPEPPPEDEP